MENKHWYAVQENEEDALDYGSYDYNEALEMAQEIANENGEAFIAYIDEEYDFCDYCERIEAEDDNDDDDTYTEVYPQ